MGLGRLYHPRHGALRVGLNVYVFTALLSVLGIAWAFGRASVFKYISQNYPDNLGAVSGLVGMAGGLGGFVLPILQDDELKEFGNRPLNSHFVRASSCLPNSPHLGLCG